MEKKSTKTILSKIGLKLIIPYLIVSIITLLIISGLIYYNFDTQNYSNQKIEEEILLKASSEINYYVENIKTELDLTSKNIFCIECTYENNRQILKNLVNDDPSIYEITIANSEGKEKTKVIRHGAGTSSELKDISTQDKFKKAITGGYYLGPVYISEYGLPFISMSLPIVDENNTKIGILSAEVDLSLMWDTISRIKVKKTGYVYVVDKEGVLIAYRDINLVKKNLDLKYVQGVKNFLNNIHSSETYTSFNDEMVIGEWKSIDVTNWGVIVELPLKEVFEDLLPLFFIAGVSIILSIVFIVIVLVIVFRGLLKPLSYLQKGVMEIKSGNLDYSIKITSSDEIGELAAAFNQMIADLKIYQNQIKKHQEELEERVANRTKELDDKVKDLTDMKTAILNMMDDMDDANRKLIKTQEELSESLKKLKETDIKKDQFISIAAHELKTPLTSIHGFSQLLQNKDVIKDAEKRNKYLNIMDHETKRLSKLVTDILDLSRIDLGALKLAIEEIDLNEMMDGIQKEMNVQMKQKGLASEYDIEKGLPKITTDREKLTEIMINLINNSIKYTPSGKITVKVFREKENIHFMVKDTGIGIAKEHHTQIFERFYQVDSSYTRSAGGVGLGLSLCHEFVNALGGRIWFNSELGKGSDFHFTLPIKNVAGPTIKDERTKAEEVLERSKKITAKGTKF